MIQLIRHFKETCCDSIEYDTKRCQTIIELCVRLNSARFIVRLLSAFDEIYGQF